MSLHLPEHSRPLWSHGDAARYPRLVGQETADVVVVGAGIAGLTTAWLLVEEGLDVVVLEAGAIGAGTTGRTTAKVSALQGLRYRTLEREHGGDLAGQYAGAQIAALDWLRDQVRGVEVCRWEERTAFTYAAAERDHQEVQEEVEAAVRAGLDAQHTTELDVPFPHLGAVALSGQAQFDPQGHLDELARLVDEHPRGRVHERSRVTAVRGRRTHRIVTDRGVITAGHVVVTTLLPVLDRGGQFSWAEPKASYTLAVEVEGPMPTGMYLSAGSPTRSLRTAAAADGTDVLVIGGGGHTVGRSTPTRAEYDQLVAWAEQHFAVRSVRARWFAHDYVPVDHLPWAGPLTPLTPTITGAGGFGKWGMTNGTAAAMVLTAHIVGDGRGPEWASVFRPHRPSRAGVAGAVRLNAGVAVNLVSGWATRGSRPVCTHLGGVCTRNDAEDTWDCPLHGSRFTTDGDVVSGPAVHRLRKVPPPVA